MVALFIGLVQVRNVRSVVLGDEPQVLHELQEDLGTALTLRNGPVSLGEDGIATLAVHLGTFPSLSTW
jgi:hypothetical protein